MVQSSEALYLGIGEAEKPSCRRKDGRTKEAFCSSMVYCVSAASFDEKFLVVGGESSNN